MPTLAKAGIQPSIPTRPGYVPGLYFATAPRAGSGASALPPAVQARRSIPTKGVPSAKGKLKRITPSIPTAPGARGRLPRVLVALATAGMGQSIPTNPVGRVIAPASPGPQAVESPEKLALDAAVANELARQAEGGYTQGEADARRVPTEAVAEANIVTAGAGGNAGAGRVERPSWRQSEKDAAKDFSEYKPQVSYKKMSDGTIQQVPYGTKGSVRPDYYRSGYSIDKKITILQRQAAEEISSEIL